MNQPMNNDRASPPWVLFVGLALGVGLLAFMAWGSIGPSSKQQAPAITSDHVVKFTDANWQKEVLESDIPVFVDFTADWCQPCRDFAPTVHKLADRFKGKVKVGTLNIDDNEATAEKYRVTRIPRVILFKGGRPLNFDVGDRSEAYVARALDAMLARN